MKTRKRLLAIILAVVLVLGMTTPGFAAYGESMGGYGNGDYEQDENGDYTDEAEQPEDYLPDMQAQPANPSSLLPVPLYGVPIAPLSTEWVNTFGGLQMAIADFATATENMTIVVTGPITVTSPLIIPANADGHTLTITGTGQQLTRGFSSASYPISVENGAILSLGNVIIDGGRTGAFPTVTTSLVFINTGGTLIMNNGTTLQNNNSTFPGGGVHIGTGTFIMNGGTISGNSASSGGGVFMPNVGSQNFTMNGGTISGNTATGQGGGLFAAGGVGINQIILGNNAVITGNTLGGNASNLHLGLSRFVTLGTGANAPQTGMNVGVTKVGNNNVFVQNGATPANITNNHFTADATGHGIFHNNGQLRIMPTTAGATRTISFNANNGTGTMYPDTVLDGENYTIKANAFTRTGWIFTGWNTAANGTGTAHAAGATINNVNADITLFAQWEQITYTLTVNNSHATTPIPGSGAGNFPPFAQDATARDIRATNLATEFWLMTNFILETYVWFDGWTITGATAANPNLPATTIQMPSNNVTATANWIPSFHVDVDSASGLSSANIFSNITAGGNPNLGVLPGNGQTVTTLSGAARYFTPSSFSATIATAFVPSGSVPVWRVNGVDVTDARISNNGFTFTESNVTSNLTIEVGIATPTLITAAQITGVTSPVATATPSTNIANDTGFTSSLAWNGNPITFSHSTAYTARITLTAASGYTFTGGFANTAQISGFSVNGIAPVWVSNNGTTLVFDVAFPQTGAAPITSAAVDVIAPVTGATPSGTATTSGTVNFTLGTVAWSPNHNPFQGGTQYTATVTLTAQPGHTFTGLSTATINGQTATVTNNIGTAVTLSFTFPDTDLAPITTAAITVTAPATGATPNTVATGTGNFTMSAVSWTPTDNPFLAATQYTASVTLTASSGHTFTGLTTATINTQIATTSNNIGTAVTLSFEFPATPTIPTISPTTVSSGTVGTLYTQAFTATGTPTITWLAPTGTLPPGLTFNMATGTLSGTPTQDGSFTFTVRAENAAGIGTQEITLIINPAPTVPSVPQNFTAIAGNGQVALGWDAPANDGGSPITGYEVSRDDGTTWVAADSNTGHTFTGLLNGNTYTFRVRAVNAVGNGAEASETATPATIPGAPQDFTATAGNTQVVLAWTAPLSNGGSAILRYEIQVGSGAWTDVGLVTSHTVTGLANGTAVTFNIRAVNAVGNGAEASATATPTAPGGGGGGGWPTAPVITITSQPANATVPLGEIDSNLYVTATVTQNATRSYRWYRATDADRTGASTFTGATTATFPKPANLTGATYYFYVVVSAPGATSVRSDVAVVTVLADTGTDGFPFIDVARTDWFYPYVRKVWENQLFQGTSHNMFTPQGSMTRAMFVQVLANMENIDLTAYRTQSPTFGDTNTSAWYFPAIEWAARQGLVQGVGNGNFQPGRAITREEMAVMLHNYVVSRNITLPQGAPRTFADQDNISYWAVDGVRAIQEAGIIVGHPSGSFAPRDTATRAEVATIFARFLEVTGVISPAALSHMEVYFDRSAQEAIERALLEAANEETV